MKKYTKIAATVLAVLTAVMMFASCSSSAGIGYSLPDKDQSRYSDLYGSRIFYDTCILSMANEHADASYETDFNIAVNLDWMNGVEIPEGYSSYDEFIERQFEVSDQITALLADTSQASDSSAQHDLDLVRRFYSMWLDWDTRNSQGYSYLIELLSPLMEAGTTDELTDYLSQQRTAVMVMTPFTVYTSVDPNEATRYAVMISATELIFGDAMYYQQMSYSDYQNEPYYSEAAKYMVMRLGYTDSEAEEIIAGSFHFEKDIAEYMMTNEEYSASSSIDKENNPVTEEELTQIAGNFPIMEGLAAYGMDGADSYILLEPEWLNALGELYTDENVEEIKDYMLVSTLLYYQDVLDRETYETVQGVLNDINGIEGMVDDESAAGSCIDEYLGMQLGRAYCSEYADAETKQEALDLTERIIAEYRDMLENEAYLDESTKEGAIRKLDQMTLRISYPDVWPDDSGLDFTAGEDGGTLLAAIEQIGNYNLEASSSTVNSPVTKTYWTSTPQEVNASYDPADNSITIGAGILGGSFFQSGMSDEEALAHIGFVIGHEISHAFDSSGRRYDENGALVNWWSAWDEKEYNQRAMKLMAFYDSIIPFPGGRCSGRLVEGEAIADLTSMKCMLYIAEKDSGFDYDTFFKEYASLWRSVSSLSDEEYLLTQDTHPLAYLRINAVVQQFDEYYETYGVEEGDRMYLDPDLRLIIW
ncbi:MAG: M13 family metallopeptidase [Oscillospiraceae bacterium]|jgi:putative endopeptidase